MYKLIALDMDGTLLSPDGSISPRTKDAITQARSKGVTVALASGRPLEGMTHYIEELGFNSDKDFAVCYNGGMVVCAKTGETVRSQLLTGKDAKNIASLANDLHVNIHAFTTRLGLITPKNNHYTEHEATINKLTITEIDFNELDDEEVVMKVMLIDPPEILQKAVDTLPEFLYEQYTVVRSAPFFLEIMNKNSHKAAGVASLAEHLDIKQEEVICMGDAGNDHHMIEWAGLGIAMGNADDDTKAIADYITDTNANDGVAQAIEKFVLNA
ncbi:sugar-phosphatase [Parasalinivibrio latis]|uniref:sugar-phosphatase n=1 Tax=Parasalinivibrio latis TaxID=2952610 RepID=UPI0030E06F48